MNVAVPPSGAETDATPAAETAGAPTAGQVFQWLRWRRLCNTLTALLRYSVVRLVTILICSALIWSGVFLISMLGFWSVQTELKIPLDGRILVALFSLLFLVLTVLLIFSTGIILYSSLFASPESAFLLGTPAPADQIYAYKFQGAVAFSSWAVVLLGSPILVAYGISYAETPWYFYALLPLYCLGFVLLPGSLGALICLLVVNFMPHRRKQVLALGALAVFALLVWWLYRLIRSTEGEFGSRDWVNQILSELALLQGVLLPARWMAEGLRATVTGDPDLWYYLALVWSNGLLLYVIAALAARRLYRRGYNRVATGGDLRRRYGGGWLDSGLSGLLGWLAPQTRLLIVKDFRTFRRDPAQWAQILIFLGLASLYFTNIGRFYQQDVARATQKNLISLLNLCATSFMLCAYTGRFVFPMLSLEGRKFWILGLLPLERDRLLLGKFAFSAIGCLIVAEVVVVLSDLMLEMGWATMGAHVLTAAVLALGLSGLSVGLGASMPNFQESDPSKLAVGFGGTLNLVAGLLFLVLVIFLMSVPCHLFIALAGTEGNLDPSAGAWMAGGIAAGLMLGAFAVIVPLRLGIRALRKMEF
jgi:ABC-2 type transport system permease protein